MTAKKNKSQATDRSPRRTPREMTPVGKTLERLRNDRGETLTEFAKASGVTQGLLSSISYGRKKLTADVLDKLRSNLHLGEEDITELRRNSSEAAREPARSSQTTDQELTPKVASPAERGIDYETREEVKTVWVIDPAPREVREWKWRDKVVKHLRGGGERTYFVRHSGDAESIEFSLADGLREFQEGVQDIILRFVIVPQSLHPHFFNPIRVLCHLKSEEITGFWAFPGALSQEADRIYPMDKKTAKLLRDEYSLILHRLEVNNRKLTDELLELRETNLSKVLKRRD